MNHTRTRHDCQICGQKNIVYFKKHLNNEEHSFISSEQYAEKYKTNEWVMCVESTENNEHWFYKSQRDQRRGEDHICERKECHKIHKIKNREIKTQRLGYKDAFGKKYLNKKKTIIKKHRTCSVKINLIGKLTSAVYICQVENCHKKFTSKGGLMSHVVQNEDHSMTCKEYAKRFKTTEWILCPICRGNYFYKLECRIWPATCEKKKCIDIHRAQELKKTLFEIYGEEVTSVFKIEEVKELIKQSMIEQWGVKNCSQSEIIKDKKRQTTLNHFGVEHPFQIPEIHAKCNTPEICEERNRKLKENGKAMRSKEEIRKCELFKKIFGEENVIILYWYSFYDEQGLCQSSLDCVIKFMNRNIRFQQDGVAIHGLDRSEEQIRSSNEYWDKQICKVIDKDKRVNIHCQKENKILLRFCDEQMEPYFTCGDSKIIDEFFKKLYENANFCFKKKTKDGYEDWL